MISLLGPCRAPLKFLNKLSGFELSLRYCVSTSWHSSGIHLESAGRLVSCVRVPGHMCCNLASKVGQEPLSFEEQVMPAH